MRSLSASMDFASSLRLVEFRIGQRRWAAFRGGRLASDLRAGFRWIAFGKSIEDTFEKLGRQIFIRVFPDLDHRRVSANSQTLDLFPREFSIVRERMRIGSDAFAAHGHQVF